MLSRVAEAMFWMSRYIERAENVARFIDVNCNLMLDTHDSQAQQWQALVNTTGDHEPFAKKYSHATKEDVIQFLTFDASNPNSIFSCTCSARENARTIRDVISADTWEQINTFYLMMKEPSAEQKAIHSPYEFFNQVRMASHLILGVTESTLSHGEGWHFCNLGRLLERTDKTSRILDVKYCMLQAIASPAQQDDIQWGAVLKSASALEMYRKRYRRIQPDRVVEFLMFDTEFPRAIMYCLRKADVSLHAITGMPADRHATPAEKVLGEMCADLSRTSVEEILASGLHEYLDVLQTRLNEVGAAVHESFFSDKPLEQSQSQSQSGQTQSQSQSQTGLTQSQG